jgi:hypothetical protein
MIRPFPAGLPGAVRLAAVMKPISAPPPGGNATIGNMGIGNTGIGNTTIGNTTIGGPQRPDQP